MKISEIVEGTLLDIYIKRDGYNYKVVSKVEYVDEQRVGVTPIASRTKLFKFRSSDIVDIVYKNDSKSWKWPHVKAGSATLKDGTKLHVFVPTGSAESFNRRSTYRLPMGSEITLTYEVLELPEAADNKNLRRTPDLMLDATLAEISESYRELSCKAYLKDLSEGGAAIMAAVKLKKGDIVSFELPYDRHTVYCKALIIRVKAEDNKVYPYSYGLSYIETSSDYVPYFFAEQRKMLSEMKLDYNVH